MNEKDFLTIIRILIVSNIQENENGKPYVSFGPTKIVCNNADDETTMETLIETFMREILSIMQRKETAH